MADEGVSVGWVLTGVAAVVASLATAVRWLVAQKEKQTEARVAAVEKMCQEAVDRENRNARKIDALTDYIQNELSRMLTEAHDRERRLASIVARCRGCPDQDPGPEPEPAPHQAPPVEDQRKVVTEPIVRDSLARARTPLPRRGTIRDGGIPPR